MKFIIITSFFFSLSFWIEDASACGRSFYEGSWNNIRQEEKTLSKFEIKENCNRNTGEKSFSIRAFESCRPKNCSWGWTEGILQNGKFYAIFKTFSAERRVEIIKQGFRLRSRVTIDYISENRKDTVRDYILIKKAGLLSGLSPDRA